MSHNESSVNEVLAKPKFAERNARKSIRQRAFRERRAPHFCEAKSGAERLHSVKWSFASSGNKSIAILILFVIIGGFKSSSEATVVVKTIKSIKWWRIDDQWKRNGGNKQLSQRQEPGIFREMVFCANILTRKKE